MNSTNMTLEYYNRNAADFTAGTLNVDFRENQNKFLKMLNRGNTRFWMWFGKRYEIFSGTWYVG